MPWRDGVGQGFVEEIRLQNSQGLEIMLDQYVVIVGFGRHQAGISHLKTLEAGIWVHLHRRNDIRKVGPGDPPAIRRAEFRIPSDQVGGLKARQKVHVAGVAGDRSRADVRAVAQSHLIRVEIRTRTLDPKPPTKRSLPKEIESIR